MAEASSSRPIASASSPARVLDYDVLSRLRPSKVFADAVDPGQVTGSSAVPQITSLSFDDTGERCITAGEDDAFTLWDASQGKKTKTFLSKKYGIAHARFTHRSQNIIYASSKEDNAIRYHSMHDNTYLSYFRGHTGRVRSLHMNPTDETFLSAGEDGTVRFWDLRAPSCKGYLGDLGGSVVAAFDNTGVVFAVACSETQTIMLYGTSSLDSAPFHHAPFIDTVLADISQPPPRPIITSLAFSNDGNYLLIGTSSDVHYVVDAYELNILRRLVGHTGLDRDHKGNRDVEPRRGASGEETGWSGDSKWVISGSSDGSVCMWNLVPPPGEDKISVPSTNQDQKHIQRAPTMEPTIRLLPGSMDDTAGRQPSRAVKLNPRYTMLAVGGSDLAFWLPRKTDAMYAEEGR